jgi:hypothetical protein
MITLNLVVLGPKKVSKDGVYLKSVIAKNGKPEKLV